MIKGLTYNREFLDPLIEQQLIETIDQTPWLNDLKRRVQHYGYRYDYRSQSIDTSMQVGRLPTWALSLAETIVGQGYFEQFPDQMIVNEYEPGQGIAPHVDCEPCFGNSIASITLGSGCFMKFSEVTGTNRHSIYLEPRSIIVMSDEARYDWKHSISKQNFDDVDGNRIPRSRRISLTFRTVNSESLQV
ncbi:alpha-ketoglutarate-dependent dioxygenase AlkB [Gimesia sp.]|uniref:alpha-ketoglutarate-dependent dioxygenase AlkB n=1 Tax=Gimesia sp. TaxID=2024833 RepID=UPI003A8F62DE